MTSYADTGFLVKLYLLEPETAAAVAEIQIATKPILLSQLSVLELRNALHLNVFQKKIGAGSREAAWRAFEADLRNGIFILGPIPSPALHEKAAELADKYTSTLGTRTLDLLHVATAMLLQAGAMLSFDVRQRAAAAKEGMRVKP